MSRAETSAVAGRARAKGVPDLCFACDGAGFDGELAAGERAGLARRGLGSRFARSGPDRKRAARFPEPPPTQSPQTETERQSARSPCHARRARATQNDAGKTPGDSPGLKGRPVPSNEPPPTQTSLYETQVGDLLSIAGPWQSPLDCPSQTAAGPILFKYLRSFRAGGSWAFLQVPEESAF